MVNRSSLDDFTDRVCSKDANVRLEVYQQIEEYFKTTRKPIVCHDLKRFSDSTLAWVTSSNFKVAIDGIMLTQLVMSRLTEDMKLYSAEIIAVMADRLGDSKEQVRTMSKNLLIFMMECYGPNFIWDKLIMSFNHKLPKVREETLRLLDETLHRFGGQNLPIAKLLTCIVKLLSDPNQYVLDKSFESLQVLYRYTGDKLRNDLRKKQPIPEAKLKLIFSKFDEIARNCELIEAKQPQQQQQYQLNNTNNNNVRNDLIDTSNNLSLVNSTSLQFNNTTTNNNNSISSGSLINYPNGIINTTSSSSKPPQQHLTSVCTGASSSSSSSSTSPSSSTTSTSSTQQQHQQQTTTATMSYKNHIPTSKSNMGSLTSANGASRAPNTAAQGAIDEDVFINSFEVVPKIQVYSAKDLDQHMSLINECLADANNDWEKRVDSLKRIRSLVIATSGNNQFEEEFLVSLKQLTNSFALQVKDLRSQIVREACITIAYLSQLFGNRIELFVEMSMGHLINLIQNSAKIMATSGIVAIRFIIENTHSARLIPPIASGISSRSKEIRRFCCEFLNNFLQVWETNHLDKHIQLIQTCIKKGIADADQEARAFARKAFWSFSSHYPTQADNLLLTFDVKTQKLLQSGSHGAFGSVKSLKDGSMNNHNMMNSNAPAINYDFIDSQNNRLQKMANNTNTNQTNGVQQATPSSRIKRSTSAVDIKNPRPGIKSLNGQTSPSSVAQQQQPYTSTVTSKPPLNNNNTHMINNNNSYNMQSIDASDILAPCELENSDLLKTDDFNFDLASKSLLFMSSSVTNSDLEFTISDQNNIHNNNNSNNASNGLSMMSSQSKLSTTSLTGSRIPIPGDPGSAVGRGGTSRIPTSIINSAHKSGNGGVNGGLSGGLNGANGNASNTSMSSSRIIHSQPGSRSTSPTPKYSYLTHTNSGVGHLSPSSFVSNNNANFSNNDNTIGNGVNGTPNYSAGTGLSKLNGNSGTYISRSANSSATKSKIPTSSRNSSRESSPGRRSNYGSERRTSLNKPGGRRLFGRQLTNNSDSEQALASAVSKYGRTRRWDDSDEASETSSICSERSFSSSIGGNRVTEDMNEAITCLSSSQWSDRRDGLVNLRTMTQAGRIFSRQEIKRLSEIFSRLFQDQHVKVLSLFLDVLNDFIRTYKRDLKEWLYVLLTRLLTKLGSESLSAVYHKLCVCLEATRSSFDLDLQFKILIQFIKENTGQSTNLKIKVAVLKYLQDIVCIMEPVDFHNSEDLKYAVCKIVSYTAEPKSVDIRKTAQAVLVALFNLNTPEFSMLLADLPKNIQETASRILKSHIKNLTQENGSTGSANSSYLNDYKFKTNTYLTDYVNSINGENGHGGVDDQLNPSSQFSHVIKDIQNLNINSNYHYLSPKDRLTSNGKNDLNKKLLDTLSKDSGVQSNGDVDSDSDGAMTTSSTASSSTANLPSINYIISILSANINTVSTNDKVKAMKDLTDLIKAGNRPECKWNENFKNILFCLFNHLDSSTSSNENTADQTLATHTLSALRELLQFQYKEFSNYIELTIMKLIEKFKESPPNELSKLVEEVICTAARCLPPEPCARVLKPLIETADYPKNLIAIRMMQKTIDQMTPDLCNRLLGDMLNALLIAWDSPHSPVRKASVFCLVSIYMVIGESLRVHLNNLSSSKVKLLNVYINRAKEAKDVRS